MKLGSFTVGIPQYKIETQVTYQTIRTPTVFERMLMRLSRDYQTAPEIAQLTLSQIFEQQLGVASASTLVGPCVEDLFYLEVLDCPVSQDYMSLRLAEMSLTQKGHDFLAREQLPGKPQQTSVQHLFLPLSSSVKPLRTGSLPAKPACAAFISEDVLEPTNSASWVRVELEKEKYSWKTANTEIHSVESRVTGVLWEQQTITIECDESGVLSVKAPGSADFEQWLNTSHVDLVWQHILRPILTCETTAYLPELSEESIRRAATISPLSQTTADDAIAPSSVLLHATTDETQKDNYSGKNLILLLGKTRSVDGMKILIRNSAPKIRQLDVEKGNLCLEVPAPDGMPAGLEKIDILKKDHTPQAHLAGWGNVFWGGQEHRAALSLKADRALSTEIWHLLQATLQSGLNASHSASAHALTSLWLPVQETIAYWQSRNDALPVEELFTNASEFSAALETFASPSRTQWQPELENTLKKLVIFATTHSGERLQPDQVIRCLKNLSQLQTSQTEHISSILLAHCDPLTDVASLESLRNAVGPSIVLPEPLLSNTLLSKWVADALTDAPLTLHEPHHWAQPIKNIRSAQHSVLHSVGALSLAEAVMGRLHLKSIKKTALANVTLWQNTVAALNALRLTLPKKVFTRIDEFNIQVQAWRELATQKLAQPEASGKRLVVLDTSALMERPELPSSLQQNDTPVIAKRVLDELDGLKESSDPEKARKARAASREVERANAIIRYESEAIELLPVDWVPTSDSRILSVALYLQLSDVILVTADRNLRSKAQAENILAMQPHEYKERPRGGNRPRNQGGK